MLLINHDQAQALKNRVLFDKRMRSDNHLNFAGRDLLENRLLLGFPDPPSNACNFVVEWSQDSLCIDNVLFRENLGWRHEGSLETIADGDHNRLKCDNRLTASHIALQQTD